MLLELRVAEKPVIAYRELANQHRPATSNSRGKPLQVGGLVRKRAAIPLDHQKRQIVPSLLSRPADSARQEVPDV
jgi:hypothetical protein